MIRIVSPEIADYPHNTILNNKVTVKQELAYPVLRVNQQFIFYLGAIMKFASFIPLSLVVVSTVSAIEKEDIHFFKSAERLKRHRRAAAVQNSRSTLNDNWNMDNWNITIGGYLDFDDLFYMNTYRFEQKGHYFTDMVKSYTGYTHRINKNNEKVVISMDGEPLIERTYDDGKPSFMKLHDTGESYRVKYNSDGLPEEIVTVEIFHDFENGIKDTLPYGQFITYNGSNVETIYEIDDTLDISPDASYSLSELAYDVNNELLSQIYKEYDDISEEWLTVEDVALVRNGDTLIETATEHLEPEIGPDGEKAIIEKYWYVFDGDRMVEEWSDFTSELFGFEKEPRFKYYYDDANSTFTYKRYDRSTDVDSLLETSTTVYNENGDIKSETFTMHWLAEFGEENLTDRTTYEYNADGSIKYSVTYVLDADGNNLELVDSTAFIYNEAGKPSKMEITMASDYVEGAFDTIAIDIEITESGASSISVANQAVERSSVSIANVNGKTTFALGGSLKAGEKAKIYDFQGRILKELTPSLVSGTASFNLENSSLAKGRVYIFSVKGVNGIVNRRFTL